MQYSEQNSIKMVNKIVCIALIVMCLSASVNAGPVAGTSCCALNCAAALFTGSGCGVCITACITSLGVLGLIHGICAAFAAPIP